MKRRLENLTARVMFVMICLLPVWFVLGFVSNLPPIDCWRLTAPRIDTRERTVWGQMNAIAVGQDRLYAHFGHSDAVKVYTLDGAYLYTIFMPLYEGSLSICAEGDEVWLRDNRGGPTWLFREDEPVGTVDSKTAPGRFDCRTVRTENGTFALRGLDILYTDASGATCTVVDRPVWLWLAHGVAMWAVCFGTIVSCAVLAAATKKKEPKSSPR